MIMRQIAAVQQLVIAKNFCGCTLGGDVVIFIEDVDAGGDLAGNRQIVRGGDDGFARFALR